MSADTANGSTSRGRRFGRRFFTSHGKDEGSSRNDDAPKQLDARQYSPTVHDLSTLYPPPSPESINDHEARENRQNSAGLAHRQSKANNLFDLFSKPKVERAKGSVDPTKLDSVTERSQTPAHFYGPTEMRTHEPVAPQEKPRPEQPARRQGTRPSPTPQKSQSQRVPPSKSGRLQGDWEIPPLYQSFPQATKHGKYLSVNASTDALLRAQQNKRIQGLASYNSSLSNVSEGYADTGSSKRLSMMSDMPELVDKVFILVTAGRLIQYSGMGYSERMPEKVVHLGPKSAAFACDLIPGKHWVIQVVQTISEPAAPGIRPSRSLLSRFRVPTLSKKSATSVLMIFNSPNEMESWLKTLRNIIEQKGGMQRSNADPESRREEQEVVAQKRLSHRYLVQRDPQRFNDSRRESIGATPIRAPSSPKEKRLSFAASHTSSRTASPGFEHEPSISTIRSHRVSSTATTLAGSISVSADLLRLEPLRETARFSCASIRSSRTSDGLTIGGDHTTAPTSACSSSPPSPPKEPFIDSTSPTEGPRLQAVRPAGSAPHQPGLIPARRRSTLQGASIPAVPAIPPATAARFSLISTASSGDRGKLPRSFTPELNGSVSNVSVDSLNAMRGTPPIQELDDEQTLPMVELTPPRSASIPEPQTLVDERDRPMSSLGELPNLSRPKEPLEPAVTPVATLLPGLPLPPPGQPHPPPRSHSLPKPPSQLPLPHSQVAPPPPRARPFLKPLPVKPSNITSTSETHLARDRTFELDKASGERDENALPIARQKRLSIPAREHAPNLKPGEPLRSGGFAIAPGSNDATAANVSPTRHAPSRLSWNQFTLPVQTQATSHGITNGAVAITPGRRTSSVGRVPIAPVTVEPKSNTSNSGSPMQSPTGVGAGPQQKLRRPTSVQIRSSHAPFLSTRRSSSVTPPPVNRQRSASQTNPTSMHALHLLANGPRGTATLAQEAAVHKHISSAIALSAGANGGALQKIGLDGLASLASSPPLPSMPSLPDLTSMPALPSMPSLPDLTSMPALMSMPSLASMPDLTSMPSPTSTPHSKPLNFRGLGLKTVRSSVELGSASRPSLLLHNPLHHHQQKAATPPRSSSPTAGDLLRRSGSSRRAMAAAGTRSPPPGMALPPLPTAFASAPTLPPAFDPSPTSPASPADFGWSPAPPAAVAPPLPVAFVPAPLPTPPPTATRSRHSVYSISELDVGGISVLPPPIPPMNPNRPALRAKHSAPNLAIAKLPPPMPPPNCPLPRVPQGMVGF